MAVRPEGAQHPSECYFAVQGPEEVPTVGPVLTPVPTENARQLAEELKALARPLDR